MSDFSVTRKEILAAAESLRGQRFVHQGRNDVGVDCVGFLRVIAEKIGLPDVEDLTDYKRQPQPEVLWKYLLKSCAEIPISEARPGDVFFMRLHSPKPRHTAMLFDEKNIIHASEKGVRTQPISDFPKEWFCRAVRIRGVVD